ncbi:MAG: GGDEF domain-containing protein, partial [Trueperaceae bacterium]|nr:GGDEF domain-containing protein [Trueperaceae bacterium]
RPSPDGSTTLASAVAAVVLAAAPLALRDARLELPRFERVLFAAASLAMVAMLAFGWYGNPDVAVGRATVVATLFWVPLLFAFAFIAFDGRTATLASSALVGAIALVALPEGIASVAGGRPDDLFVDVQVVAAYAVLIAALRFFADLHVVAGTLDRTAERMRTLAHTDALTGLANRRQADVWLRAEVERSQRYGHPFAVLMLDLDRFKRINDAHGHAAGDRVLVDLGRALARIVRATDAVARWGGEEFLVLLPETGRDAATALAEQMRASVGAATLGAGHHLSVSVGVAAYHPPDRAEDVVARADAALYAAKAAGRDAVRVEEPAAAGP